MCPVSNLAFFDSSIFVFASKISRRQEEPEAEAFDVEMVVIHPPPDPPSPVWRKQTQRANELIGTINIAKQAMPPYLQSIDGRPPIPPIQCCDDL